MTSTAASVAAAIVPIASSKVTSPITHCYIGHFIDAPEFGSIQIHVSHCCAVNAQGYITLFKPWPQNSESQQNEFKQRHALIDPSIQWHLSDNTDPGSQFYVPAFSDVHIHAPQWSFTGSGTGLSLLDWLSTHTFPAEAAFSDLAHARRVYSALLQQLLCQGTTSVVMYATIHLEATKLLVDLCESVGMRAVVGRVSMDQHAPEYYIESSVEQSLADTRAFIQYVHAKRNPLLIPCLTPRFLPTCSPALLRGLSSMLQEYNKCDDKSDRLMLQSHLSESLDEIAFTQSLYSNDSQLKQMTDTQLWLHYNLMPAKHLCVMGHCVHLSDSDVELLSQQQCAVGHCALSNSLVSNDACLVQRLVRRGVTVALGTDLGCAPQTSILDSMRHSMVAGRVAETQWRKRQEDKHQQQQSSGDVAPKPAASASSVDASIAASQDTNPSINFQQAFHLATVGGATALGLKESLGRFAVGCSFDALHVDVCAERIELPFYRVPHAQRLRKPNNINAETAASHSGDKQASSSSDDAFTRHLLEDVEKFLLMGNAQSIRKVYCQGRPVSERKQ